MGLTRNDIVIAVANHCDCSMNEADQQLEDVMTYINEERINTRYNVLIKRLRDLQDDHIESQDYCDAIQDAINELRDLFDGYFGIEEK